MIIVATTGIITITAKKSKMENLFLNFIASSPQADIKLEHHFSAEQQQPKLQAVLLPAAYLGLPVYLCILLYKQVAVSARQLSISLLPHLQSAEPVA